MLVFWPVTGQRAGTTATDRPYTLNGGDVGMVVDGQMGARITSFTLGGTEILGTEALHPMFYGSTLWLGPQGKWKGHKVLDASPYTLGSYDRRDLILKSGNDSLNGFRASKHFRLTPSDSSVTIRYTITNISQRDQRVSPWEVTRVPTGGLAFFPKGLNGDFPRGNEMHPLLKVRDSMGVIWYPSDRSAQSAEKLFMDGSEGWLAYVRDGTIFIKKFPVIDPIDTAPWEKNVEIYVNREKTYLELENQGIYEALAPGGSLTYEVKWYARQLPSGMRPEVGNIALVEYIRKVVE